MILVYAFMLVTSVIHQAMVDTHQLEINGFDISSNYPSFVKLLTESHERHKREFSMACSAYCALLINDTQCYRNCLRRQTNDNHESNRVDLENEIKRNN